jgi:hypothetical protein
MVGKISMIGFFSTSANDLPVIWNKKAVLSVHMGAVVCCVMQCCRKCPSFSLARESQGRFPQPLHVAHGRDAEEAFYSRLKWEASW